MTLASGRDKKPGRINPLDQHSTKHYKNGSFLARKPMLYGQENMLIKFC